MTDDLQELKSRRRDVLILMMRSLMLRPADVTHCPHAELAAIVPVFDRNTHTFSLIFCCRECAVLAMRPDCDVPTFTK